MAEIGSLPLFHRIDGKRVVVIGDGAMAEAKRRLVERAGGIPCSEAEAHHAALAFVALEDDRASRAACQKLRAMGLLVNVADRPELCDFTTPSILDREPVLVAISTSGASAGLAKHIRLRLERLLPQSLGALAAKLRGARDAMRSRWPDADERRGAVDAGMAEGGPIDPLDADSAARIDQWLAGADVSDAGQPTVIRLQSDDPEDLTLRQARLLGMADVVLHAADIPPAILNRARADALRRELPGDADGYEGLVVVIERV